MVRKAAIPLLVTLERKYPMPGNRHVAALLFTTFTEN